MTKLIFEAPKRRVFTAILGLTVILLLGYSIFNFILNNSFAGILESCMTLLLILSCIPILKKRNYLPSSIAFVITTILISIFLIKNGGIENTGIFWIFLFPIAYFFFLGRIGGVISFSGLLLILLAVSVLRELEIIVIVYSKIVMILFLVVFLTEALLLYLYERILEHHIAHENALCGIIPICSHCKKIRDDKGYWSMLEQYFNKYSDAEFSHSICPECVKELYPDFTEEDNGKKDS